MNLLLINPAGHFVKSWSPTSGMPYMTTSRIDAKRFDEFAAAIATQEISNAGWIVTAVEDKIPAKTLVFTRGADGASVEVACSACMMCKNYIWVTDSEIERPSFCPFCGIKFEHKQLISAEEMREIQVL